MFLTIQEIINKIDIIYEDLSMYNLMNTYNIIYPLNKIIYVGFGIFMKVNK